MKIIRTGASRTVILIGRYAIKVPTLRGTISTDARGRVASFAGGVLANQSEYVWHNFDQWEGQVAPVLRSWLCGLVQVYPRCEPAPADASLFRLDPCPGDYKLANYGVLDGRLVRVDYEMTCG